MKKISCRDIFNAVSAKGYIGNLDKMIREISIDSRKITEGCLFIPIKGERFDGHAFLYDSLAQGAAAALSAEEAKDVQDKTIILVEDTGKAIKELAAWYRSQFDIPIVAVTGSVGKTSTKDMISSILGQKFSVLKTQGNFNNEIGLPLTVFNLEDTHQAAILEMGMSDFGEISRLSRIAKPNVAVITNIGVSHIGNLGSRENILKEKLEILEGISNKGTLLINNDDDMLSTIKDIKNVKIVTFGINSDCDLKAVDIRNKGEKGVSFSIIIKGTSYGVDIPVPGIHNVYNALAGIGVGLELGLSVQQIINGITKFTPGKMRMNIIDTGLYKVINDAYNASPQSMEAALKVLSDIGGTKRKIAVLGDMLELGDYSSKGHRDVGRICAENADILIACGTSSEDTAKGALEAGMEENKVYYFATTPEAISYIKNILKTGDTILIKGSRGMKMEEIAEQILKNDIVGSSR